METSFAIRVPTSDSYVPPVVLPGTTTCPGAVLRQATQDEYGVTYTYQSINVRTSQPNLAGLGFPKVHTDRGHWGVKYAGILAMGSAAGLMFAGVVLGSKDYMSAGALVGALGASASWSVNGRLGIS